MKSIFETVIRRGSYDLQAMLARIEEYHVEGRLTAAERDALTAQARSGAKVPVNAEEEIGLLWAAVRALQGRVAAMEGGADGDVPAFMQPTGAHDAYFSGDRVVFGGSVYQCIAPDGVACVWSPEVMPGYWVREAA